MIFKKLIYIIVLAGSMLGVAACHDSHEPTVLPVTPTEETMVNLAFSVIAPDAADPMASRGSTDEDNYFEEGSGYELIHTLRIIILRTNGEVEHNKLFTLSETGEVRYDDMKFKVVGGEMKKIYIIANEASVDYNFESITDTYVPGTIENLIIDAGDDGVLFNNSGETKKWIPMSEVYQTYVKIPEVPLEKEQTAGPFFITRAAVKFSFSVAAYNGVIATDLFEDYYVTGFKFYNIADREYFLPRAEYASGTNSDETPYEGLSGQFITSFTIPENAEHNDLEIPGNDNPIPRDRDTPLIWSPPLYYCESLYRPLDTNPYSISLTVAAKDQDGNTIKGSEYTFGPVSLTNLDKLPRNTHVKVHIEITKYDITAKVTLVPYIGVTLQPWFGF